MKRSALCWITLAALGLLVGACSSQNASDSQVHPDDWVLAHGDDAGSAGNAGDCRSCHGQALDGGSVGVACRDCHVDGPPFKIHPSTWGADILIAHLRFAEDYSWTTCATAACHGEDLGRGHGSGATGPSCFADSATNSDGRLSDCHGAVGPPPPESHGGVAFSEPAEHGPLARGLLRPTDVLDPKSGQFYCRNCHGLPENDFEGGYVAAADILDADSACSTCHPDAKAHPTNWQGSNDMGPYFSTHQAVPAAAIDTACALCHRTDGPGSGPLGQAPSCFTSSFVNAAGSSTGCHANGPGSAPHAFPFTDPELHGAVAKDAQAFCQTCHGTPGTTNFAGGIAVTACSQASCHPAARAHPTNWQGNNDPTPSYQSTHRTIQEDTVAESCSICHKTDGVGEGPLASAPSCYSASFTNADGSTSGCHAEGPGTAPHAIPYSEPAEHGSTAKADLAFCQACHGTLGTTAFDGGFVDTACSTCHPDAGAHPTNWQGTNDTSTDYLSTHRSAGSLDTACAICHNIAAAGPGPNPDAPSCYSTNFTNGLGGTSLCHPGGPGAPHDRGSSWLVPSAHGADGKQQLLYCQECHGTPGTRAFDGGIADTACSTCHPDAGAHPTNWQGTNDDTPDYLATHWTVVNWGVDCALCHDTLEDQTDPTNPGPSCYSAEYTNANGLLNACHVGGPGPGHVVPFLNPLSQHGQQAKLDLAYCQHCHAEPFNGGPGSNPRFDVPFERLDNGAGRTGCELCHRERTAHPVPWAQGLVADHKEFGNKEIVCALCHGENLLGPADNPAGVGPSCRDCHVFGFPIATGLEPTPLLDCTSCHNVPPDGVLPEGSDAASGEVRPNRPGAHAVHSDLPNVSAVCNSCHNGAGTGTAAHYDTEEPANVASLPAYLSKNTGAWTYANGSCTNVSCHGGRPTPVWASGSLDVDADCTACHRSGSTQYNSYSSGEHTKHLTTSDFPRAILCVDCHNTVSLATNHFTTLDTQQMEGPASATIGGGSTLVPSGGYISATGSCAALCHDEPEFW